MHLSGLEIHGFKSFPNKTKLVFSPGVMAIVGPNGCGKTNIVDAVRWVLGEQRSNVLRSEKMEHVIFSGSLQQKQAPKAEVTLILENDQGLLPEEYSELAITRRLTRDLVSDYQINRRSSRLKDIRSLFEDTGLGPDSYSIIELKMVETILSARTDERRRLFEEAAGVTGYKARLKTTRYRLKETRDDLVRLADLLSEVTTRRNSLQRQVSKARRYRHLRDALRVLDLTAASREITDLRSRTGPLDENLEKDRKRREELAAKQSKEEQQHARLHGKLVSLEETVNELARDKGQLNDRLTVARREIDVLEERVRSGKRRGEERETEQEELQQQLKEVDKHLRELTQDEDRANDRAREIQERLEGMRDSWEDLQQRVSAHNQRRENAEKERVKTERDQARIESDLRQAKDRLKKVESDLEKDTENQLPQATQDPKASRAALEEKRQQVELAEQAVTNARNEENAAREEHNEIERNAVGIARDLNSARERVQFLERIVHSGKGRSEAIQTILSADLKDVYGRIGDAITVNDESARKAVAAAIERFVDAIALSAGGIRDAVKLLEGPESGRVTFAAFSRHIQNEKPQFAGGKSVKPLSNAVKITGPAKELVESYLSRYWMVENLQELLKHAESGLEGGWGLVTPDGAVLHPDGSVTAGSGTVDDLGARSLLEDARKLAEDLEAAYAAIEIQKTGAAKTAEEAKQTREKAEQEYNHLRQSVRDDEQKLREIETAWNDYRSQVERLESERNRLTAERDNLRNLIEELAPQVEHVTAALDRANENYQEILDQGSDLRSESEAMRNARDKLREQQVDASGALERVRGEINRQNALRSEYEHRLERLGKEKRGAKEALEDASDRITRIKGEVAVVERELETVSGTLREKRAEYEGVQREKSEQEGSLSQGREELTRLGDRIHSKELEHKDLLHRMISIRERILDTYEIDVLETLQVELPLTVEEGNPYLEKPLGELREMLRDFGPVNQMALEEFEVVDRRWKQLTEQHDDLERAVNALEDTIREINGIARKRFLETFSRVEGHFVGLFSRLFGGGEAALSLAEGDPLEAGIHILASPRGKKLSSIDLMSGGEKAMTAIALLFALYLERPSPFCFLDEVDAPLDDVNVLRFNRLLREFTDRTQFLVVTHNKLTMERADRLYGVTMEEEGVSKLVAVEIGKTEPEREGVES